VLVLRGELVFQVGDRTVTARAGSFLHVPAGTVHSFRYGPGGAEASQAPRSWAR